MKVNSTVYKLRRKYSYLPSLFNIPSIIKGFINWPDYIKDIFFPKPDSLIEYRLSNGLRYQTRSGTVDKSIIVESNIHKIYTPPGFQIKPGDIIFDLGAQIGTFTVLAAHSAKIGHVYAYEPASRNYQLLLKNIRLNKLSNVTTFNEAIGDRVTSAKLSLSHTNTGGHSLVMRDTLQSATQEVQVMTLAQAMINNSLDQLDFLKMDVEGSEYDILYNCPAQALKKIKKISLEFHQLDTQKMNGVALSKFLEEQGFKVKLKALPGAVTGMLYAKRM